MKRWTQAEVDALQGKVVKKSKFRNKMTVYNGRKYSSKLEARCAEWLDARRHPQCEDPVLWYISQVPFVLEGGVVYRADFMVARIYGTGSDDSNDGHSPLEIQVIDATGALTQTKMNKLKQVKDRYGLTVLLYGHNHSLRPFHEVKVSRRG